MKTRSLPIAAAALFALLPLVAQDAAKKESGEAADPIPLAHENSDIPADPAVTWGLFESGMRFAILPNAEPPGRVSVRLYVDAGSLMETEDQRGLAHFLEHMAFNGTESFAPGEMIEYFQRLGMGFGNHTNAHTSFHETVYKLELPKNTDEMLDEGLNLIRDYADGMLLLPDEIEDERGIILAEKRSRDSVQWRTFVEEMKFVFPDHLISQRMPIGVEEVISTAPRERFVEFYENWYTPNRMVLVVVGDIEVDPVKALLEKHFADMPYREKRQLPDLGKVSQRELAAHYHFEDEAGETSVSIESLTPRVDPPDNTERRARDLRRSIASAIVNRRLERIAKREDSPISSARMHAGDFFDLNFALYGAISADCKPEDWEESLILIEQELRRAIEHGFTEAELTEVKANLLNQSENAAEQMATRRSRNLADMIVSRIGARRVFTSPADDLIRVEKELASVTAEECQAALAALWNDANERLVSLSGNAEVDDALNRLIETYRESASLPVDPPEEKDAGAFSYRELPEAGAIAESTEIEDLEVTQLRFENNVRVNLKVTDFEDETIHVRVRIGGGRITEPKDQPGLSFFTSSVFDNGGLAAHSLDDLKQIFAGQSVSVGFGVDDDAFTIGGTTNSDDLRSQLLLMRAYLTNPGYRDEAVVEFRRSLDYIFQQIERTPGGFAQDEVASFLHGGDPRFGYPDRETLEALTMEDVKAWLADPLARDYLEMTVVGDFDLQSTIELIAGTFGSLPKRAAEKPGYEKERIVTFPGSTKKTFEFPSEIPKAMTVVHWPTTDIFAINETRRLGMLGAILDDRLRVRVREELGDAYSPFSHNLPSDTWTDYGYIFATVTVDPEQAESVAGVIEEIASDLATGESIDEDELERAKKPQVTQIEEMRRTNRYWMGSVLQASQEHPERLDWARSFVDDYKSITVEDVNQLAAKYLKDDSRVTVLLLPKEPEEESEEDGEGAEGQAGEDSPDSGE